MDYNIVNARKGLSHGIGVGNWEPRGRGSDNPHFLQSRGLALSLLHYLGSYCVANSVTDKFVLEILN